MKPDLKLSFSHFFSSRFIMLCVGILLSMQVFAMVKSTDKVRVAAKPTDQTYSDLLIEDPDTARQPAKSVQQQYDDVIRQADNFYINHDFENARAKYLAADNIKPGTIYVKDMLNKTCRNGSPVTSPKEQFDSLVFAANKSYQQGNLEEASAGYRAALAINPEAFYLESLINDKIEKTINLNASRDEAYTVAIRNGDQAFGEEKHDLALEYYQKASTIHPDEKYPKDKITEINIILSKLKANETQYKEAIANGDKLLQAKQYYTALAAFTEAAGIKPGEEYPPHKIAEINATLDAIKLTDASYARYISQGNAAIAEKNYTEAIDAFQSAANIKPAEIYPMAKITSINKILSEQKQAYDNYTKTIASADAAFSHSKYDAAIVAYNRAIKLMPGEKYPRNKVVEIKAIQADQKIKNEALAAAVSKEDFATGEKKQPDVIADAKSTLQNKQREKSPQNQTTAKLTPKETATTEPAINNLTSDSISKVPEMHNAVKAPATSREKLDNSPVQKPVISNSSASKPTVSPQNANQEKYNEAIIFADKARDEKNYTHAVNGYKAALKIKPSETYPQEQINSINLIQSQENAVLGNYKTILLSADNAFDKKDYTGALAQYQKALELSHSQKYPQEKIATINTILGQQKALQENYNKAITSADRAFDKKSYKEAITGYKSALKLKPAETYPKEKIESINSLLGQTNEQQESYLKTIAEADKTLNEKKYEEALLGYEAASKIKPGEAYPKQKIAAINIKLGQLKARQEKYNDAIRSAGEAFNNKDYVTALTGYKIARALSPDESYAKEQIEAINTLLAQQKTANENYAKAIMTAEKALAAKDYPMAISGFQAALEYKPEESYPLEKITIINGIIALDKDKLDKQYAGYINQADAFYANQDLPVAQQAYKMASTLKPNEDYPKNRYDEIAGILMDRAKALKAAYDEAIASADLAYKSQSLDQAVAFYTKALEIKPGEIYPGQMIARIRKYMIDNSVVEVSAESFILKKDLEKRFRFKPVDMNLRKNNYLVVRARVSGKSIPKLYVNYGSESMKNGGVVLKNINSALLTDFVINISIQDKWFREDNDWLSLYSENGDLEITSVRISQGAR